MRAYQPGVSIIVPTYKGVDRLPRVLASLEAQTLPATEWEVIVVHNGADDGSLSFLRNWQARSSISMRVFHVPEAGASSARNAGLAAVRFSYVTFLDDDDSLQPEFLATGLATADAETIALLPILDEHSSPDGKATELLRGLLYTRIAGMRGQCIPLALAPWALGFNACKLVPARYLDRYRYDQSLRSGEDVAFFAQLLQHPELKIAVPSSFKASTYLRRMRSDSVSRKRQSFDFSVEQRLDVVAALQRISVDGPQREAADSLVRSQFRFVADYLEHQPEKRSKVASAALSRGVYELPWSNIDAKKPHHLVFSFCFPPFADPAANVVAKRIAEREQLVDVICADMSPVRQTDPSSLALVEPWLVRRGVVEVYPSFASWNLIAKFAQAAVRMAKGPYESVYSRALWTGSHVAGCLYKLKYPAVHWEAEFSDPLCFDAKGNRREGEISRNRVAVKLRRAIKQAGWGELPIGSHFALTELATFLLADTLSFSNVNQLDAVLAPYPGTLQNFVREKTVIAPQPQPPKSAYSAVPARVNRRAHALNIGYFGSFYENRGLNELLAAASALGEGGREIVLHVFTNNPEGVCDHIEQTGASIVVEAYGTLPYLEFLNAATQCDVLLVVDADTRGSRYVRNPFLPSKVSDYAGAGVPIWAVVEPGSPLDGYATEYKSNLDDALGAARELARMIDTLR